MIHLPFGGTLLSRRPELLKVGVEQHATGEVLRGLLLGVLRRPFYDGLRRRALVEPFRRLLAHLIEIPAPAIKHALHRRVIDHVDILRRGGLDKRARALLHLGLAVHALGDIDDAIVPLRVFARRDRAVLIGGVAQRVKTGRSRADRRRVAAAHPRNEIVAIRSRLVIAHDRERIQFLRRGEPILSVVLHHSISAVPVVHHEVDVRTSLVRRPSWIGLGGVEFHASDRGKTVPLVEADKPLAVAIQLDAAVSDRKRKNLLCHTKWCTRRLVAEDADNIAVRRNGKTGSAISGQERPRSALIQFRAGLWRDRPAIARVRISCGRQGRRKRGVVRRGKLCRYNAALFKRLSGCFA